VTFTEWQWNDNEVVVCITPTIEPGDPFPWVACEFPERRPNNGMMFHLRPECTACNVAFEAYLRNTGRPIGSLRDSV